MNIIIQLCVYIHAYIFCGRAYCTDYYVKLYIKEETAKHLNYCDVAAKK